MTTLAQHPAALELRTLGRRTAAVSRLTLRATADGWSLLTHGGELVFHGLGVSGRRACLEHARARGVLVVIS